MLVAEDDLTVNVLRFEQVSTRLYVAVCSCEYVLGGMNPDFLT